MSTRSFAETERLYDARQRTIKIGKKRRNQWEGVWRRYSAVLSGNFSKTRRLFSILYEAQLASVDHQMDKRNTAPSLLARNASAVQSTSARLSKAIFGSQSVGTETSELLSRTLMKSPELYDSLLQHAQEEYRARYPREDGLVVMWKAQDALDAALAGSSRLARWSEAASHLQKSTATPPNIAGAMRAMPSTILIRTLASRHTELASILGQHPAQAIRGRDDDLDGWLVDLATLVEAEAVQNRIIPPGSKLSDGSLKRLLLSLRLIDPV